MTLKRLLKRTAIGVLLVVLVPVVLVLVLGVGLPVWTKAPAINRLLLREVNAILEPQFRGQIVIHELSSLSLAGINGAGVEILDADGQPIILARGVDVQLAVPQLIWRLVANSKLPLQLTLSRVSVEDADLLWLDDPVQVSTLVGAFDSREPAPLAEAPGRDVIVELDDIQIARLRFVVVNEAQLIDGELNSLQSALRITPELLRVEVERLKFAAEPLPGVQRVAGELVGGFGLRLDSDVDVLAAMDIKANIQGLVGESPFHARGSLQHEVLDAALETDEISAERLAILVPGLKPKVGAKLSVAAAGKISALEADVKLLSAAGTVNIDARLTSLDSRVLLDAKLDAADINLRQWIDSGPESALGLSGQARLELSPELAGDYKILSKGAISNEELPRLELSGRLSTVGGVTRIEGALDIDEEGAVTRGTYRVEAGEATRVNVNLSSKINNPRRAQRLGVRLGRGHVRAAFDYDVSNDNMDVELSAELDRLRGAGVSAERVALNAVASGNVNDPQLAVRASAARLQAQERVFQQLGLNAEGKLSAFDARLKTRLDAESSLDAKLSVSRRNEQLALHGIVKLVRRELAMQLNVETLKIDSKGVSGGVSFEGSGRAKAQFVLDEGLEKLDADLQEFEPAPLVRLISKDAPLRDGKLSGQVHLRRNKQELSELKLQVRELALSGFKGGTVNADIRQKGGLVAGSLDLQLGEAGTLKVQAEKLRLPETTDVARLARNSLGRLQVNGKLDLKRLQVLLPATELERASGVVELSAALERERPGSPLQGEVSANTRGLVIVGQRPANQPVSDRAAAIAAEPLALRGIDFELAVNLKERELELQVSGGDRKGPLFNLTARSDQFRIEALRQWRQLQVDAALTLPERELESWPALVRPKQLKGQLGLQLKAKGNVERPEVELSGSVKRLRLANARAAANEVEVQVNAKLDRVGGEIKAQVMQAAHELLGVNADWRGDLAELANGPVPAGKASPVQGKLHVALNELPLELLPQLDDRHLSGRVSGRIDLDDWGRDAKLIVLLDGNKLKVSEVKLPVFHAGAKKIGDKLEVDSTLRTANGMLQARGNTGMKWGASPLPQFDDQLEGALEAKRFPLEVFEPLVSGSLSELKGELNAKLQAELSDSASSVSGVASIEHGVLHIPKLGQRLSDVRAEVQLAPGSVSLKNFHARGTSGVVEANASARLKGLLVTSAEGKLNIDEDQPVPLTLEGESVGDVWGKIKLNYELEEANKRRKITVNVERLDLKLPAESAQDTQSLDDDPTIRIGHRTREKQFALIPLQPLHEPSEPSEYETNVVVHLGEVSLEKGEELRVNAKGELTIDVKSEPEIKGRIETTSGKLFVSGKSFDIERATVTFTGANPPNPTIGAIARYDSPAGYTVFAEFTGTGQRGTLRLSSEPSLSQDEILTLLLFGVPDGSVGVASSETGSLSTAVSVAGGVATQSINKAISKFSNLDVSARVDTSHGAPRPELVVQLTPRLAARVTQALGEPPQGQSPDRTFLTLDFRFATSWLLSSVVGDRGAAALDLVWRRRY